MQLFKSVIKSHYKSIILFFVSISLVVLATSIVVYDNKLSFMENTATANITEYEEVDIDHLCKLLSCESVMDVGHHKIFSLNKSRTRLIKQEYKEPNIIELWRTVSLIDNNTAIYIEEADAFFILSSGNLLFNLIMIYIVVVPISLAIFIYPLFISIRNEKENAIRQNAGNEALLANKSMIMITENIHHELNTPLEIIDNKIEKIHKVIDNYLVGEYKFFQTHGNDVDQDLTMEEWKTIEKRGIDLKLISLAPDFEFIRTSSEQIYNILEKMKGFKHMRYSNGNKTIYDVFEGAFKIISISNSNYTDKIDDKLKAFSIESNKFRNADLLGIAINNIKNSIEADASQIIILFGGFSGGFLKLRIIDNGGGIPSNATKHIFEPNFSTKSSDNSVRGNGMYLNKQIIRQGGGDTTIVETSKVGTTIELLIPSKERGI